MKKIFSLSIVVIAAVLLGAGCEQTMKASVPPPAAQAPIANINQPSTNVTQGSDAEIRQPSTNIFDPYKNKGGDSIAGLKITSIAGVDGIDQPMASNDVKFSGQITLSGTYDYSLNDFAGVDMVCFAVMDPNERLKLPVLVGHPDQNTRFCFSNLAKAKAAFGPSYGQGQATITVDHYELIYAPAEVVNQAELLTVVSKKPIPVTK